jgi:hypothetical protein
MTLHSIYNNAPKILTAVFLALGFYFLARTLNGYTQDQQHLMILSDLALSVGLFVVAIPASLLLADDDAKSLKTSKLKVVAVVFSSLAFLLALSLVFSKDGGEYFGFENVPAERSLQFLVILFSSIIVSLSYLVNSIRRVLNSDQAFSRWPLLFHFAACGIGLSLVFLLGMQSLGSGIQADATIVLSEFLKRLVLVGAIGQAFMALSRTVSVSRSYSVICLIGCIFILMGFQTSSLRISGSELLYVFNQFSQFIGLGLIFVAVVNVLFKTWRQKTSELLNQGQWVGHSAFFVGLILMFVSNGPFGFLALSGITQNFQLLVLAVAVPLLIKKASEQDSKNPSQAALFSNALSWCGFFVCFISILVMSPFGGSLVVSQTPAFKPILGIMMSGLFLLVLSYFVSLWDLVLHEWI